MYDFAVKFTALSGMMITNRPAHMCPALNQLEHYITIQKQELPGTKKNNPCSVA
jgi:hypothetical protein